MSRLHLHQRLVDVGRGRSPLALGRNELRVGRKLDGPGRAGLHHFQAAVAQRSLDLRGVGLVPRWRLVPDRGGRGGLDGRRSFNGPRLVRLDRSVQRLPRRFLERGELRRRRAD